jgi:hypothetical protein
MTRTRPILYFCLIASILVVGCGGGSSTTGGATPQAAVITGQWSFIATDTASNKTAVFANLTPQGNGTYFATGVNSAVCDLTTSQCQVVSNTPNITATVSSTDQVQISMTNVINVATGAAVTVNGNGTVDAAGTTMSNGTWTSSSGASGTFTGNTSKSFTGSYTGTFNSTVSPAPIPYGVSLTLAQDASYNLTATAAITNSICFSNLTFSGHAVGGVFYLVDSTNSIAVAGVETPTLPANHLAFSLSDFGGLRVG